MIAPRSTVAFTLIEIAFAMALLVVGLTAITSVYLTALRWAAETRYQYTAITIARQALESPWLIEDRRTGGIRLGFDRDSDPAAGWLNGYYVQRVRLARESMHGTSAHYDLVRVRVYAGGDASDGDLAHECISAVIAP